MGRFLFIAKYYLFFILVFVLQKPLFMAFHIWKHGEGVRFGDWFSVMYHGLPMDFSTAGYISVIPFLIIGISVWLKPRPARKILTVYTVLILTVITIIFSVDLDLYGYWGFRIDATPLAFLKSPKDAVASFSTMLVIRQLLILPAYFAAIFILYKRLIAKQIDKFKEMRWFFSPAFLIAAVALFLPIRGGFSASTMNAGWVYFSNNMFLNHSAINPLWNFMDSLFANNDFEGKYKFMDESEAQSIVKDLFHSDSEPEQIQALNSSRPNVILVVLEGFAAKVIAPLGGIDGVTPNLNKLSSEGILFTNFYATSFRTDRGVSAIMSAYPSQPQTCIMKYPTKTNDLPNIGKSLANENYDLAFYYGGDANFTNMRSYLVNAGFQRIVSDRDFSKKEYTSSWGAADHVVFNRMLADLKKRDKSKPFFNVLLTLSSHEPFRVPMPTKFEGRLNDDLYKNAVYYSDSCIGNFIAEAKQQDWWDNTVIVFISDHSFGFPEGLSIHVPERYHIIMLWLGGAVKEPAKIEKIGYQPDFVATLFGQMNIDHSKFVFSKNLLDKNSPEFAFYTHPHGAGFIERDCQCVIDLNANEPVIQSSCPDIYRKLKAFLQYSFSDFAGR